MQNTVMETTNDWTNVINKGKVQADVIFLEFSKAFDVAPDHRLLMKVHVWYNW